MHYRACTDSVQGVGNQRPYRDRVGLGDRPHRLGVTGQRSDDASSLTAIRDPQWLSSPELPYDQLPVNQENSV